MALKLRKTIQKCSHGPLYISCPFLEYHRDPDSSVSTFPSLDAFSHSPPPPCPARMSMWLCLPAPSPPAHHSSVTSRWLLCWSVQVLALSNNLLHMGCWKETTGTRLSLKKEREMMGVRGGVKGTQSLEQEEC